MVYGQRDAQVCEDVIRLHKSLILFLVCYLDVLSVPIMQPRWSWTRGMIYALQSRAKWQEHMVSVETTWFLYMCLVMFVVVHVCDIHSCK